ncbi:purple acid phosphatase family protein [Marinagarivorans algicola]|uniref:purple acid phosphatase family protein n=1 Tax=Marinagarivorans algicola TaxID=1513270 RepID=UPI0006B61C71|nr:metallophosphoesterase family protein [Marinagarivorans algicola]
MKHIVLSTALISLALHSISAQADWFFRGTPNNWGTSAMTAGSDGIYHTCQKFGNDRPRFKVSRYENWDESYPRSDWGVESNTSQLITINTSTKRISVHKVNDCNNLEQPYITDTLYAQRGPYLQTITQDSVIVRWQSRIKGKGVVRYGLSPSNMNAVASSDYNNGHEHSVQIDNLTPNTRYYYAVGLSPRASVHDNDMFFETAPPTGSHDPVRIWVSGDTGDSRANSGGLTRTYQSYLNDAGTQYTNVWLMLGDNAYHHGEQSEYQRHLFDMFPKLLKQTALWPTYGNHDAHRSSATRQFGPYFDIFNLPTLGEAGGVSSYSEAFHSFDYGNIHFVNLDSSESAGRDLDNMKRWLQNDLAANANNEKTDWLIAFFHHPPYSKGSHDSDNERDVDGTNDNWGGVSEMKLMRENFVNILEKYSADLVLTGHSHTYERSMLIGGHYQESPEFSNNPSQFTMSSHQSEYVKPLKANTDDDKQEGTIYVVAGNAAKSSNSGSLDHPVMVRGMRDLGSMVLEVEGLTLKAKLITDRGEQKDFFRITKSDAQSVNNTP